MAPLLSRAGYPHLAVTFTVEDPTRFGKNVEGVLGMGGWNPNAPETTAYFERYKKAKTAPSPIDSRAR